MFEAKMAGGVNDPDELVVNSFKAFNEEGKTLKCLCCFCRLNVVWKETIVSQCVSELASEGKGDFCDPTQNKQMPFWNHFLPLGWHTNAFFVLSK